MNFHELVQVLTCMVHPNGYKKNVILRDCNVACLQLFPGFMVIGPQIMHVCDVSGPESLVFDPVRCEQELAKLLSGLEMKLQVSITGCCDKEQDCFHSM